MTLLTVPRIVLQQGEPSGFLLLATLLVLVITAAGMWKTFAKANYPGVAALIPFVNLYLMLEIGDNEWWWLLVLFVPIANLYALYKMYAGVSRAFGGSAGFAFGLWFVPFVFWPLLGFGDYTYGRPSY